MKPITIRPFAALKLMTLAALALLLLLLNGCEWAGERGNGKITSETRAIDDFNSIVTDGAFTVNWTAGPAALKITTDKNLLQFIRTSVSSDRLRIDWSKPLRGTEGIKVEISSPSLKRAETNGAVKFTASNLSGSEFYLEANGASKVTLSGNVNAVSAEMNGANKLYAESLVTRAMEVEINGAGKAEVNATQALKVVISGAGKVTYSGDPTVSKEINGAGKVRKRQ
ncbi:MAG: head GIN domain-containing protein [Chthoniobacterales bacterium]